MQNKAVLDAHEHFYTTFMRSQTITGLSATVKNDLLRVMREEFWPGYSYDEWCPHCVGAFLQQVYAKYDDWKKANIEPVQPEQQQTIKIRATFPKNKMN